VSQKTYILIGCHDEGFHTCYVTRARNIKEAIDKFNYWPYSKIEFEERGLQEGKQIVYEFYGLLGPEAYRKSANYVDGDSNSEYIIIEVGNEVQLYPAVTAVYERKTEETEETEMLTDEFFDRIAQLMSEFVRLHQMKQKLTNEEKDKYQHLFAKIFSLMWQTWFGDDTIASMIHEYYVQQVMKDL